MAKDLVKERLTEAFHNWNKDKVEYPDDFGESDDSRSCAENQARTLMEYLEKIPIKK